MAGFLSAARPKDANGSPSLMCSLAVVSVGATIFESMRECDDENTALALRGYVERHRTQASVGRGGFDEELLTTLFALQDGVSRFRQGDDDSRGGVGMMDTIEFMNDIATGSQDFELPAMSLISGRACILIRDAYRNAAPRGPAMPRTLWFNPGNNLEQPPDRNYVKLLQHPFPGTIVALRFCIGGGTAETARNRSTP